MKLIFSIFAIFLTFQQAHSAIHNLPTKDYLSYCQKAPFDKESYCHAFFEGVLSTMTLKNAYLLCFRNNSDREIYANVMKKSTNYLRENPPAAIYSSATIIYHSLLAIYSCDGKGSAIIK
jgi:hypothetical protein